MFTSRGGAVASYGCSIRRSAIRHRTKGRIMQSFIDQSSRGDMDTSLTADQLDQLTEALEAFRDEQGDRLRRAEDLFRVLVADATVDAGERAAARRVATEAFDSVQESNRALEQIVDGTYGACIGCGRAIPFERLEVVPRTRTCVACPSY